jgi:DNA-binding SARP family transcriptional activator
VLQVRLLGALEVELDGVAIESPATQRPWALLGYLALAGRPVSRSELASTFWPDVLDQSARASLRSALWALRRKIGDALLVGPDRIALDAEWIDAQEFERRAAEDPAAALELCRGELLEGLEDEWALLARERHRARVIELLEALATRAERDGDLRVAVELTRRQVERDPFDEEAHRRLMMRLAAAGDRSGALRGYQALAERLRRELGVAPAQATRELVDALRAESPATATPMLPSGLLPLIGRDRELAGLEHVWVRCASGNGAVATLRGEAGIGKTRLSTELRLRAGAAGVRTASSAALDLGGTAPFSLWAELIRELVPTLPAPPQSAAWADDVSILVPSLASWFGRSPASMPPIAPDLQRARLFEAIVALIEWAARDAPLLLVLEDLHTADSASLELTGYVARRLTTLPVMMLLTRRELPQSAHADMLEHALRARGLMAAELTLEPLAADSTAALARAVGQLSEHDVARVVRQAEGNALFAVESARAVVRGIEEIAPSLRGAVRAAIAPLDANVRTLLEVAAVAARALRESEIEAFDLGEDSVTSALQTGMLTSDRTGVTFRHALLRGAVYEEIAPPRRRSLHRRWAQALLDQAGGTSPAEIARHLRLADADAEAVPQLALAAAEARALAALDEAVAYLEEALAIAPDRTDLWLELGELQAWRVRRQDAEMAFQRALDQLEDPLARARALLRRARAYHGPICVPRGVLDSARTAIETLDAARLEAPTERSEALAAWAWSEAVAGSVTEAERLLAQLSAESREADDLRVYDVGHARALALMRRGRFVESYGPSIAAGEAIARAGRPDLTYGCWANAASAASAAGEHERALEFIDRGMQAIADHGLESLEVHLLGARSFVLRRLGLLGEAQRAAEAEQAFADRLARAELIAMAAHDLGLVALDQGRHEMAASLLEASLVDDAPISRPLTRLALGEALARQGHAERAVEQLRATVLEPLRPSDFPETLVPRLARVQGLVAFARGERAEAERRLEESIAGWERLLERTVRADSITSVLADLGRPVVGLVEPERELARAQADLDAIRTGAVNAVVS